MQQNDSDALIAHVRRIAAALPGTAEKLSHGEQAFFVNGRMFAMTDNDHHDSGHVAVWCNAPLGAQEALVRNDPAHFFIPPYVGGKGWVGMRLDGSLPWSAIEEVLGDAHAMTRERKR